MLVLSVVDVGEVVDGVVDVFVVEVLNMLVILEEFWTVDVLIIGVVVSGE